MTRGQRIAAALIAGAVVLLAGRAVATFVIESGWYTALGARAVWNAKVSNTLLMYIVALVVGTLFALVNFMAVRRSVIALIVPARVGNVEIGEEVSASRLMIVTIAMSLAAALVSTIALPSWTPLALWRAHVTFGEVDPYFNNDLSYYVTWLPLETAAYVWAFILFAIVTLSVCVLYGLTPSLEWGRGGVRASTHVRRHVTVLAAILILFTAWGAHLDTYQILVHGSGAGGVFTRIDHEWLISANLTLTIVSIGGAVVLLVAGWMGQRVTALVTVALLVVGALTTKVVLPWIARTVSEDPKLAPRERPYIATQRVFTARAFPPEPLTPSARWAADSSVLDAAGRLQPHGALPSVVYPGAQGVVIEADSQHFLQAPRFGNTWRKILAAWAEQNPALARAPFSASAALVGHRDVRERVRHVAPIFAQSRAIGWRPTPYGIIWVVDLYTTSETYPLSASRQVGGEPITYRHHAATAYIGGTTGAVVIVPDSTADPIARAWFAHYGGPFVTPSTPREVTMSFDMDTRGTPPALVGSDSVFRARINFLYTHMRSALEAGDLRTFGIWFDSLGAALGAQPRAP